MSEKAVNRVNAGPAEDRETEANTVAPLHAHPPYLVWHAYHVSFYAVRDNTRRGLATPIASVSLYADRKLPSMAKVQANDISPFIM